MQSPIHEGYEYQDYFTVSIILQLMLKQTDAEIIIDRKDFSGDKFDDLKVKTPNGTTEFQIKYSDDEYSHKLAKDDFANGNGHDTALCDLFASWKTRKESENDTQIKLCLAWNRPDDDDPIVEFLKPIQEQALPFSIVAYSFDGEVFWPVGNLPPKTWRKFNLAVKSGLIDREAGDEHQIPFQQYLATAVEEGEIYTILDNPESLIDFIRTLDRELEDEDYLWPGTSVSKLLDVHIEFDFLNGRYIAINQEKDVVFIMKKWSSSYKGDSEYHGNAIPLYSGTKLYIKKEYIGILEQQFGTLMMKTCVQSYTQDY